MKKFKLLLLSTLIIFILPAKAQIFQGYITAGLNLSKVEGDRVNNNMLAFNKPGINAGVGIILDLGHNFSTSMELDFNQKGALKRNGDPDSLKPAYLTRLNFIDIPLLIHYTDKGKFTFGTGFTYSRLVGVKWVVNGRTLSKNINDGFFSENNVDWIADFKMSIVKGLKFNFRYSYSLTSIWSGTEDQLLETVDGRKQDMRQNNSMVSIRLIWVFNEKESIKNKEELKVSGGK